MSEWGIEQHSTFGNCGGCFVEGLSLAGGIAIVALVLRVSTQDGKSPINPSQPKIESVKSDAVVNNPLDTIVFNGIENQR